MPAQKANLRDAINLTAHNVSKIVKGLPARAQLTIRSLTHLNCGQLSLHLPDGRHIIIKGKSEGIHATLMLHNWNLPQKVLSSATIGIGEAYIDGDWDSPDVTALLELFLQNRKTLDTIAKRAGYLFRLLERTRHWLRSNTRTQAKKNISAHYDLGNEFYGFWLDETMTYSSAIYSDDITELADAQRAKYQALAQATGIERGDRVLEIGCGWGGFAEYAASELDCHVTGLSLSKEQLAYAQNRLDKLGLSDKVDFKYQDYRDEQGVYDRIISIEMFEAVGEKYWDTYFSKIRSCLKANGKAGLQIITINPDTYAHYRANPDFIQRYIFPGGMLPADDQLDALGQKSGLSISNNQEFALDYAKTLAQWRELFHQNWDQIKPLDFDERFKRLWSFYLSYCEAGFRGGNINVRQVVYE